MPSLTWMTLLLPIPEGGTSVSRVRGSTDVMYTSRTVADDVTDPTQAIASSRVHGGVDLADVGLTGDAWGERWLRYEKCLSPPVCPWTAVHCHVPRPQRSFH